MRTTVLAPLWAVPRHLTCRVSSSRGAHGIFLIRLASQVSMVCIHVQFAFHGVTPDEPLCSLLFLQVTRARCAVRDKVLKLILKPYRHLIRSCPSSATSPAVRNDRYRRKRDRASIHSAAPRRCSAIAQCGRQRRRYFSIVEPTRCEPKESK